MKLTSPFQRISFFLFLGLVIVGTLRILGPFGTVIFAALLFTYVFHPLFRWLCQRNSWKPAVNNAIVFALLLLIVLLPFFLGLRFAVTQIERLAQELEQVDKTQVQQSIERINADLQRLVDIDLESLLVGAADFIDQNLGTIAIGLTNFVAGLAGAMVRILAHTLIFCILFLTLLPNADRLRAYLVRLSPVAPGITERYFTRLSLMTRDLLLGLVLVSLIQALIAWVVFKIIGVPLAEVLAVLVFVAGLIPFLGISMVTVPLSIVLIAQGQAVGAAILLLVHAVIINNVDLVLRPLLTSEELNLHSTLVILGVIGGLAAFGLMGLFLGPFLIVLLTTSLDVYMANYGHPPPGIQPQQPADA